MTRAGNCAPAGLTVVGNATYDKQVGISVSAPAGAQVNQADHQPRTNLVPVRSTVGQLPLEQHIGVRIPDGQPNQINNLER